MKKDEPIVAISTDEGLKKLLERYQCESKEDLDDLLWYEYGIALIECRKIC